MSAVPGCMVRTYSSSCLVAFTGRATAGIGRSRWNGSNGLASCERRFALVFPRAAVARLSKSKEHTRARAPALW